MDSNNLQTNSTESSIRASMRKRSLHFWKHVNTCGLKDVEMKCYEKTTVHANIEAVDSHLDQGFALSHLRTPAYGGKDQLEPWVYPHALIRTSDVMSLTVSIPSISSTSLSKNNNDSQDG